MLLSSPELSKATSLLDAPEVHLDLGQANWLPSRAACRNHIQGICKYILGFFITEMLDSSSLLGHIHTEVSTFDFLFPTEISKGNDYI